MKVVIKLDCDNATFEECGNQEEAARILRELANRMQEHTTAELLDQSPVPLFDLNGNRVGQAIFVPPTPKFHLL